MIAALALVVALVAPVAAQAAPLEYKGVALGTPAAEAKARLNVRTCSEDGTMCALHDTTYANEPDVSVAVQFVDGELALVLVTFKPPSFGAIADALAAKYGAPKLDVEDEYRTVGGAVARQRRQVWEPAEGGRMMLSRYGSRITEGKLTLMSASAVAKAPQRLEEKREKAKGDI